MQMLEQPLKQIDRVWAQPNPKTIEFSDKKRHDMFKPFLHMEKAKLTEMGHQFQEDVLAKVEHAKVSQSANIISTSQISEENLIFVKRMQALVDSLATWKQREQCSQMSKLDWLKIDFLYITDLQNVICEYLQNFASILKHNVQATDQNLTAIDGGPNGPYSTSNVKLVVRTLRLMVSQATNCAFFGCVKIILQITTKHDNFKEYASVSKRQSLAIYEDLTIMVEILFQRMYSQKRPFQMLFSSQEKWDTNFKKVSTDFQEYCNCIIKNFAPLTQLLIYKGGQGAPEHLKALEDQEGCDLASRLSKLPQDCELLVSDSPEDVRDCFRLHAITMSLLMGQYFDLVKQQKSMFELHVDPSKIVQNLILIISSPDPYFTPELRVAATKVLEFLCELDTHPEFRYSDERNNPYFEVVTKNYQDYVSISKRFAEFYSPHNLQTFIQEMDENQNNSMQIDEGQNTEENQHVFSSQIFLRAFLGFLYVLIKFRARSMISQLFPQLVEPIVKIVTVMPRDKYYIVNLDCQKIALQILKEITRSNIQFDDSRQLALLIDRLRVEFKILKDDYDSFDPEKEFQPPQWLPFKYDDTVIMKHTLARRQDLIGSFLRFLCYTIIRMEPNQISINQNFVVHSRKILESNIFEECLRELVFENNPDKNDQSKTRFQKVIDPIYLTCVQLYSYVFNDLHQKIGEYVENGLLSCIVNSLSRRVPRQHDFLVLTCKFMRLLLLNQSATKILLDSKILSNLQQMALEHESYNDFLQLQQNRDQLTLLSQLASESQELSDQMMQTNVVNLQTVIDLSWDLTEEYLESERINALPDQTPEQIERRKEFYGQKQAEFEKVVENVCYMLLFQVHEQLDNFASGQNQQTTNVQRSIAQQVDLQEILKRVITTPTICSAASNFLVIFGDLVTVVMILGGDQTITDYIKWLGQLLIDQICSLKRILNVEQFNLFLPSNIKTVKVQETAALVESDPDKLELLFKRYKLSGEDLVWVTIAKIHAYLDLILVTESIARQAGKESLLKISRDFFLRPEISRTQDCLRTDIFLLSELLRKFQYWKFCEKFEKKVNRKSEILDRFKEKLALVDWTEYTTILEPHNDYEQALNLHYTFQYAKVDSYMLENQTEIKNKFRFMLNPDDTEVPESSMCKKKCMFFINRTSQIYKRERPFVFGGANSDLKQYSESSAVVCKFIVKELADRCQKHLERVLGGQVYEEGLIEGVDMELIMIRLQLTPLMQELGQLFVPTNKVSKSATTAFFLRSMFEQGIMEHIFFFIDWACKVLLTFDENKFGKDKLTLHQQLLHECLIAPMNLVSVMISGEFLKRGELKYYLQPNELSAEVAILKFKLFMMSNLYQPMVEFFIRDKSSQFLQIADKYDKEFSLLYEGIYCILCANSFFGSQSAFDAENLKLIRSQYSSLLAKPANSTVRAAGVGVHQYSMDGGINSSNSISRQLTDMGFMESDVLQALAFIGNDIDRALDYLCEPGNARPAQIQMQPPPQVVQTNVEESKQGGQQEQVVSQKQSQSKDENQDETMTEAQQKQTQIQTIQPAVDSSQVKTTTNDTEQQIGDNKEVIAACELEFRQRRKAVIELTAQSLIRILPEHFIHSRIEKREQILMIFLLHFRKEEDKEIKDLLQKEILSLIRNLVQLLGQNEELATINSQEDQTMVQNITGRVDWMLLNCLKWAIASEQFDLPKELSLSSLGDTLADQLHKNITQMSHLTSYQPPDDSDSLSALEKRDLTKVDFKTSKNIVSLLFNILHHVRIVYCVLEEIKSFANLQSLQQMMSEANQSSKPPVLDDLTRIVNEIQYQFKISGSCYFIEEDEKSENKTITKAQVQKSLSIDAEKAGVHLTAYFNCLVLFFKELSQVSGYFHEQFGGQLIIVINKALKCLLKMAQIGPVGSFDFSKAFIQKNLFKVLLQAKVIDKKFQIESDVWRPPKKVEDINTGISGEQWARIQHQQILGMFRALVREVSMPKKEIQKRLETQLKRQLYRQFLQNFKRNEEMDFHDYLQSLSIASKKNTSSPVRVTDATVKQKEVIEVQASQQRAQTKDKSRLKESNQGFMKPQRPTNRAKSEEKAAQNNQQGSKRGATNAQSTANRANQLVSNKILKKLFVKYDDYNQSKLDDFIGFNKYALDDQFTLHNNSLLQACSRIAVIKKVEVAIEESQDNSQEKKLQIEVQDPASTCEPEIKQMLSKLAEIKNLSQLSDKAWVAELTESKNVSKVIEQKFMVMNLRGKVHDLKFSEHTSTPVQGQPKKQIETKQELRIVLKRQVLREMIFDADFNPQCNFLTFGQTSSSSHLQDSKNIASAQIPTKTQNDLTNQLLEMIVEQTRGLKMDILKIVRNPTAFLKPDRTEPIFVTNDTVLKIQVPQQSQSDQKQVHKLAKLVVEKNETATVSKQYFFDYASIINALVDILEKQPLVAETVLRHNDGKTLKFLLRNIFFIMSVHIDGKNDNQVIFKNMQSYNSQKLSDRLQIVICFLKALTTITKQSGLKQQTIVNEIQRLLVSLMSKNLIGGQQRNQAKQHNQLSSVTQLQHSVVCQQLQDSTKLVAQYNSVWILTQFLFYRSPQQNLNKPEHAIINQAQKLDEQVKLHVVKMVLLETQSMQQHADAKGGNSAIQQQTHAQQVAETGSQLAFLSHIKKLLDNLEECQFLFTKAKVPCMHMCIWAVTSILKIFENRPELFLQIHGPPPPSSDSDSDHDGEDNSLEQDEKSNDDQADLEMQSDNGGVNQQSHSQQINTGGQIYEEPQNEESEDNKQDDDEDDEDDEEEGEDGMSESDSYGSEDFMEGNEDLSSNRDQSFAADQDMIAEELEGDPDLDGYDLESYGSLSDYDDEDSSALIEIPMQNLIPVKGTSNSAHDNQNIDNSSFLNNNPFEIIFENRPQNDGNNEEAKVPNNQPNNEINRQQQLEAIPEGQNAGGQGEDESYYSVEEIESYEPPLSYDMEDGSVLSIESNEDPRDMYEMAGGMHGEGMQGQPDHDDYTDFDANDPSGFSMSDEESERHHHPGSQMQHPQSHPTNIAHLPVHVQLWTQVNQHLHLDLDPLEDKVLARIGSLNSVLDSVAVSHWPYECFIGGIQMTATSFSGKVVVPLNNHEESTSKNADIVGNEIYKDEQGEEIVSIANPDQYRDKPTENNQPSSLNQQSKTSNAQPQQPKSALDIEGMDPLFLETLGAQGLQNIADSHQIQNTVVNSANMISRDSRNMQQSQSRYDELLQSIRSMPQQNQGQIMEQIQSEIDQRALPGQSSQNVNQIVSAINNSIGVQEGPQASVAGSQQQDQQLPNSERRGRFLSVDTVAVSMLGPNDSSRQIQTSANQQQRRVNFNTDKETNKNKVQIRGTQYMQNSFNDLHDLIEKFQKNQNVSQSDKQCQEIIKLHLLPQESESAEAKFNKIHDCMQMALVGFKIFEKDDLQIQSRIRLLFRIPSLRICLILRVLKLLTSEVENLVIHRDQCLNTKEFFSYQSKQKMPIIDKDGSMVLQEMPLDQTISVTLFIIEQLQECLQTLGMAKAATQQSIEIAKTLKNDELLSRFATLTGLGSHDFSIMEQILSSLQLYFDTVMKDPWVLPIEMSKSAHKTSFYNNVLASLRKTLLPLSKVPQLTIPVVKICELVVAPSCLKLTKQGHQHARKILNDICQKENLASIGKYLENRLEKALTTIIELLEARKVSLQNEDSNVDQQVNQERFVQLLDETKELLKLSGGVQKIKNQNICRQDTLASLFSMANHILQREQIRAESSPQAKAAADEDKVGSGRLNRSDSITSPLQNFNSTSSAFMYRSDIKEMILICFALCEYNLRTVFSQGPQIGATTITTNSQEEVVKSTTENNKTGKPQVLEGSSLIDTTSRVAIVSSDQEMATELAEADQQQDEIYKVIESQLAAQWLNQNGVQKPQEQQQEQQGTDKTAPPVMPRFQLDQRLRTIIGFFISNKKLINVFIRVNQQVVNVQLKNLVVKIPQILEFDTKRLIWRIMLKKTKQKVKRGQWEILVRRDQAFDDSFAMMRGAKADEWKVPLRITFQDEAGVDEGGLTKEWFTLLSKHMFNEDMALFLKASSGSTYYPNPKSVIQADHLDLFEFIGKFVGKALMDQQLLECYFVKAFYKLILEMALDQKDLEDYDQELYKSLTWILSNEGAEHLCSYFVDTQDYFGDTKTTDLCEGGADKLVTDANKEEYVKLVANYRLSKAIEGQMTAFKNGLFAVVPRDLIKIFDNRELELLISGLQVVDVDDLKENTTYQGCAANNKTVLLFWEALHEFDNSERAEFIQFVTGSSKVPVEGFKGLRGQSGIQKFTIAMVSSPDQNRLPQSHTCINQIDLPQYKDKETMKRMLLYASKEGKTFTIA